MRLANWIFAVGIILCAGAQSAESARVPPLPTAQLSVTDVENIIAGAVTQAKHDNVAEVVAVTDTEGNVLGVFDMTGAPANSPESKNPILNPIGENTTVQAAIQKARTTAFLSTDQNAFSTRTAAFIVTSHFPPGIANTSPGPLFGLPFSSLPCGDVQLNGSGLTGNLGGIPIYRNGTIAGGIGVDGTGKQEDELVALAGTRGIYTAPSRITADKLFLDGIRLQYTGGEQPAPIAIIPFASLPGATDPTFPIQPTPTSSFPIVSVAGVEGELRAPIIDSPLSDPVKLTASDVSRIINNSVRREKTTRSAIRLPIGVPTRMQVGVTDRKGNILGIFRTSDATMFSLDIVIQKGRTVTSFSDPAEGLGHSLRGALGLSGNRPLAVTSRTVGFLAQPFYPPGIDGTAAGPLFGLQQGLYDLQPGPPPGSCLPNGDGITEFPGSTPLYKKGVLVGGLGISGDGVDQDDYVTVAGAKGYLPPAKIRADRIIFRGTRLPYFKFPRHPGL